MDLNTYYDTVEPMDIDNESVNDETPMDVDNDEIVESMQVDDFDTKLINDVEMVDLENDLQFTRNTSHKYNIQLSVYIIST